MLATKYKHKGKWEHILQNRSKEEEKRIKSIETTQYYAISANKSAFEHSTTANIKRNHIARKFLELKQQEDVKLETRREKLRQLLAADEEQYRLALIKQEETKEERIERMRERVKSLKAKRESERKVVVEEKLLQKWRNDCNELKEMESKLLDKEVALAREAQLKESQDKKMRSLQEKKYYDELWEKDRQKKIEREERDKARQKILNDEMLNQLQLQSQELYDRQLEEARLREEEARLQRQEIELQNIEEARAQAAKLEAQREIRADLDKFNKAKILQRAREVQEALELDLSIVNDFFEAEEKEKQEKSRKREELKREMMLYREHLKEMKRVEVERHRELEKLYHEEEEKLWRTRAEKWRKEQRARDKLMKEVLQGRQEQLRYAMEQNQLRLMENKIEQENIKKSIEAARIAEEKEHAIAREKGETYRRFLGEQLAGVHERKKEEKIKLEAEIKAEKESYREFQDMLEREKERIIQSARRKGL